MAITVHLRAFKLQVSHNRRRMRYFLTRLEKNVPRGLQHAAANADQAAWQRTDCRDCANCCKTMSPTYTKNDISRISAHLGMSEKAFKDKWLYKDKTGDWMNVSQPCQFLDTATNLCKIYEVRPGDCAGFPHHNKKLGPDYMHVFKQNVEFCPVTYRMVQALMENLSGKGS
ncbi:MAG TPA: YkgJ family cysteine cluster protein [Puia sp.]|nr:YkgJ family cysteine cluster protein [Puia sp.]